ncbi:MAG TPA: Uma2 family endonuclease [Ilumatobacter sp.]|nr:Uma2 family endonuclease [Ilumatobacter sp.]
MTMLVVQSSTEELPELEALIERRRALGLDTFDEWWEGVYRVVGGPSPEHGLVVARLCALLLGRCDPLGLWVVTPMNVGIDKWDAKVPDIAVTRPDTARTSPAYMATAELVVEIMSPREIRGEKLPFYAAWNVKEYLEVDLPNGTVRLLANRDGTWEPIDSSEVIELTVGEVLALVTTGSTTGSGSTGGE